MDRVHTIAALHERRERVFLVFAGIFLGCMTMLNILGITRFIHIGPLALAVGVLPYPLTFLCTDFISEFYGRRRANFVVWVGLLLNVIVIGFLWLGQQLPAMEFKTQLQRLSVVRDETITDPSTSCTPSQTESVQFDFQRIHWIYTPFVSGTPGTPIERCWDFVANTGC